MPKSKEFLQTVMREPASLGTKWHVSSTLAGIDTRPFDQDQAPRLVELEAAVEDAKMADVEAEGFKGEDFMKKDVNKEVIKTEADKNEVIEPSTAGPILSSIESKYIRFTS
jgi:hypothetical protein